MPIQVAIADDHSAVRLGMKYLVEEWMPESTVHFAQDLPALLRLLATQPIDLIVLDINIPGGNTFQMVPMIRNIQAAVRILMLSAYEEDLYALRYIDSGADGYLQKDSDEGDIKEALNTVYAGRKYLSSKLKEYLLQSRLNRGSLLQNNPIENLTNRELEISQLLIAGKGVGEIAKTLFIHTSTVGTYKSKIFDKLCVRNVRELIDAFSMYHV
ncbi:response regulator transcription factor [Parapedobacter indicus]|uniref:Two component transcriptional regulator, LuxR family n=1 Tax=Parapedobacter indicus TaxID=1477437 RepID=A0A1I3CMB3_9SPHI|nr:response regulator transcription factor [Parapedobacter indicus]PPL04313.1 LuxR family two component transcriptional regulator [Parapedobacter indicus]SFH75654.1 two component transcriptional regulator, LuxR family [Parapedobacter indicus]